MIRLTVPRSKDLEPEQLELIEKLAQLGSEEAHEHRNVIDRVKDLFA